MLKPLTRNKEVYTSVSKFSDELLALSQRLEDVRRNSPRLAGYQQSELTEIKTEIRRLASLIFAMCDLKSIPDDNEG